MVPSLLLAVLDHEQAACLDLSKLRWLVPTGEALPPDLCHRWFAHYPAIPLLNAYGPAECSDDVAHYPLYEPPAPELAQIPIGGPIANTQLYILDTRLQPVPIGIPGELYVGGVGVGRGYLNEPARTAQAFLSDPFATIAGARIYKTGDRARYLLDGNIVFLGRVDHQIKIRGYRIEPGEIEAAIRRYPDVQDCVVAAREDVPANRRLVAYLVVAPGTEPSVANLHRFLKDQLPDYMAPAAFVILPVLPLTPER